ncbi:hypothetical protein H8B13_11535 [Hymenobacter sp. BT188]|uniref:hypothetical protein n=1 Tax=Hymenobacter sp. BT188 TaxID=2763504 RepID=UPI0016516759|nr:hypothetical protein [Hymenobacter sp. BT188]MBC6607450.1 hypothetical protein [Hymenobacter sp. BT188]
MPLTIHSLYYENAVGRLFEHADAYAVVQYKPGKRQFSDFKTFLIHIGNLLTRRGWTHVLTDQRVMSPFTDEERALINQEWIHNEQRKTIAAILLPDDVFARLSSTQLLHDAREGSLFYHVFQDEMAAATWLRQTGR